MDAELAGGERGWWKREGGREGEVGGGQSWDVIYMESCQTERKEE